MKEEYKTYVINEDEFKAGHQALARIISNKPQYNDHALVAQALWNAISAGAPTGNNIISGNMSYMMRDPNIGVTFAQLKALLATWDSWCEEKEQEDGEITLSVLKPFDFKKVPKRIEIRDGRTVWKEIKW